MWNLQITLCYQRPQFSQIFKPLLCGRGLDVFQKHFHGANWSRLVQTCLQIFLEQSKLVKKLGVLVLFDQITWVNIIDSWNFVFLLIFFWVVYHKFISDISHIFKGGLISEAIFGLIPPKWIKSLPSTFQANVKKIYLLRLNHL